MLWFLDFLDKMEINNSQIRTIIYYRWKCGLNAAGIWNEMSKTLGNGTVSVRTVQNWVNAFANDNFNIADAEKSGRPSNDALDDEIDEYLALNKHATTREIADDLNTSQKTVWRHLKAMGKKFMAFRWIPYELSQENRDNRVGICNQLLEMHRSNDFLNQLITVDEIWLYWQNQGKTPGSHHKAWRASGDGPLQVVRHTSMTTKKHLCVVFWDHKGLLVIDTLSKNQTMTAERYCQSLDKLKDALLAKRRRDAVRGLNNFHLLQDNARPHTAAITQSKLAELQIKLLPHPPYSPDLAPSDFYLFSPLKSSFKGRDFQNSEEMNIAVKNWFDHKDQDFFNKGIKMLPERWQRCVNSEGKYFDKLKDDDDTN